MSSVCGFDEHTDEQLSGCTTCTYAVPLRLLKVISERTKTSIYSATIVLKRCPSNTVGEASMLRLHFTGSQESKTVMACMTTTTFSFVTVYIVFNADSSRLYSYLIRSTWQRPSVALSSHLLPRVRVERYRICCVPAFVWNTCDNDKIPLGVTT